VAEAMKGTGRQCHFHAWTAMPYQSTQVGKAKSRGKTGCSHGWLGTMLQLEASGMESKGNLVWMHMNCKDALHDDDSEPFAQQYIVWYHQTGSARVPILSMKTRAVA